MSVEIFQPSDLNRRGRALLDAARERGARIRDKDGLSLIVLPEERVQLLELVARFSENLFALEKLVETTVKSETRDLGGTEWTWLRVFDADDLHEFIAEMRQAILEALRAEKLGLPDDVLQRWRVTALALEDPLRRSILVGPIEEHDYVEVGRPEAPREATPG